MVIVIPYKAPATVKQIHLSFEKVNLELLDLDSAIYLNTKELTETERNDRTLDYLGGFELIDSEIRLLVIEGIGGKGNSMDKFYQANERERPNDKKFKMLYNPDIKFKNRMYQDFNCAIKRIKLRESLTSTINAPDIYLRAKVPEDIYDTLQKFAEIRKLDRAVLLRDFNLYPTVERLTTLERKYGDAINKEDFFGFKEKKKRAKKTN